MREFWLTTHTSFCEAHKNRRAAASMASMDAMMRCPAGMMGFTIVSLEILRLHKKCEFYT
jgi:hypothetical protein